jgi:hypothetical protein
MKITRFLFTLTLALILGLVSVAARMPDQTSVASLTVTICSGDGEKTIEITPDGAPLTASHICLDCCFVANALPINPAVPQVAWQQSSIYIVGYTDIPVFLRSVLNLGARAPPRMI